MVTQSVESAQWVSKLKFSTKTVLASIKQYVTGSHV